MTQIRPSLLLLFSGILLGLLFNGCRREDETTDPVEQKKVADYDYKIVHDWNELFLEIERYAIGHRPGPSPRASAYMGLSAYEACVPGMEKHQSVANLFPALKLPAADGNDYHWPTVVNASYGYLMPRFHEDASTILFKRMTDFAAANEENFKRQLSPELFQKSKERGEAVAAAIWAWAVTDNIGHLHYRNPTAGYRWQDGYKNEWNWRPTKDLNQQPRGGVWGQARTFVVKEADKICRPPLAYSTDKNSEYYSQALEVYSQNTPTLSYEDEWVGEFWSDDLEELTFSPGPRWIAIGDQVLKNGNHNLETALLMTAKVGIAINDASVACWQSKYHYNIERPHTYINRVMDPKWEPALYNPLTGEKGITPPFPAYPSGHSTMGAAGAEALGSIFGYAYGMTDKCHINRTEFEGKPRSFGSFYEMAQESAWSRVPLGVHWRMDCEEGMRFGTEIGRKVNNMPWNK